MKTRQLCTFTVGNLMFGVAVTHVQEVLRYQQMTRVPLAPTIVQGLINLRGQIVTALDMRARLGLPQRDDELPMNVVLRRNDGVVSLLVDTIGDVIDAEEASFEVVPETVDGVLKELIQGIYKLDHNLLLVLDVERVTPVEHFVSATQQVA